MLTSRRMSLSNQLCNKCNKTVEGKNKSVDLQGLKCSQCDKLVHWSCDGMTKEMFGNIKNAVQYFRCQECVKATKDGPNGLLAQIQVTLNEMNGKMTGFMERLTGVEKDVKALKDKMVTLESQGQGSQTLASLTRHVKEALKRERCLSLSMDFQNKIMRRKRNANPKARRTFLL